MPAVRDKQASRNVLPAGYEGPKACGPYELSGVLDVGNLVLRTLNTPAGQPTRYPSVGTDYPHIYNPRNLGNIRIATTKGRVISSIGIYPTKVQTPSGRISVGGINCFVTHPDHRRKGIGEAVLLDAHAKMRANGHHIGWLSTRIQDYYRKFGWEVAGRQRSWTFDRGNIDRLPDPAGLKIDENWRAVVDQLDALHSAEPTAAPRGAERFTLLAERKFGQVYVARRGRRIVAYAGVRGASINEHAGKPADVAALIRAVFGAVDDPTIRTSERPPGQRATPEMHVLTPASGYGLPAMLGELGIPSSLESMGLILMLDASGLFRSLGIRDVKVRAVGDGYQLTHETTTLDCTPRELVKLVFGPERVPGFAPEIFPIDFYIWQADRV